jgi:hypothetical protein
MDLKEEKILGEAIGSHWYYVPKGWTPGSARAVCVDPGYPAERTERYRGREIEFKALLFPLNRLAGRSIFCLARRP